MTKEWRIWASSTLAEPSVGDQRWSLALLPVDWWDEATEMLADLLEDDPRALGPVPAGRVDSLDAIFIVEADDLTEAVGVGADVYRRTLAATCEKLGVIAEPIRIEAEPEDYEPLQLVGATDVGRILDVTRQRVYQLMQEHPDFPKPVATPSRGALWDRRAIVAWGERDRRPGRPQHPSTFIFDVAVELADEPTHDRLVALLAAINRLTVPIVGDQAHKFVEPHAEWDRSGRVLRVTNIACQAMNRTEALAALEQILERNVNNIGLVGIGPGGIELLADRGKVGV